MYGFFLDLLPETGTGNLSLSSRITLGGSHYPAISITRSLGDAHHLPTPNAALIDHHGERLIVL